MHKILRAENSSFSDFEQISIELLYRINPGHCYTIITDPFYENVLTGKLFREIGHSGYFVINVPFDEKVATPWNRTLESLIMARKAGCRCYLMLLANDVQMEYLLQLVDRERAISVEANVIMLHDYRLFLPHMFHVWKRFVNVIFIRQLEHTIRGRKRKVYELATVPFPLPISKIFVTRNIDFWRDGHFRRGGKLIKDKNKNMFGYPLRTVVLKHTPGVSVLGNLTTDGVYAGVEIEVGLDHLIDWIRSFVSSFFATDS